MVSSEPRKSVAGHPPHMLGGTAIRPVERKGWEAVRYLLHNPETGEILTRTPKSWFLIFVFYVIYYSCLAAFWYGMLNLFFLTITPEKPKFLLDESLIGTNPGVGMRPSQPDVTIGSSVIFLQHDAKGEKATDDYESASNIDWAKRMQVYYKAYDKGTDLEDCQGDVRAEDEEEGKGCKFDVAALGDCATYPYGYQVEEGKSQIEPCILMKINRIFGWKPTSYEGDDLDEFPDDPMPESVKTLVKANREKLYIDCQGENPADRDALSFGDGKSKMTYFPSDQGIPFKYFPYTQAGSNYHNPLVAVKFKDLPVGQLLHIECKLWAPGIQHIRKDRVGLVHFELILQ